MTGGILKKRTTEPQRMPEQQAKQIKHLVVSQQAKGCTNLSLFIFDNRVHAGEFAIDEVVECCTATC